MKESSGGQQSQEEDLLHSRQISHPNFLCPSNNPIVSICTNKACEAESALICDEERCLFCYKNHELCQRGKLKILTKLLKNRFDIQKNFQKEMLKIEDEAIEKFKTARKNLFDKYSWGSLEVEYQEMIKKVFVKQKSINFRGKIARSLLDSLREMQTNDNNASFILSQFKKESNHLLYSLNILREDILHKFCKKETIQKQEAKMERKMTETPNKVEQGFRIESTIIKTSKQDMAFLSQILNKPQKMVLIYRASEGKFSAQNFHLACDNIPNTCTLIHTEFNKIIGGYTPLCWKALKRIYIQDLQKRSFIFSVTFKQKMSLVSPEHAIINDRTAGPCFGNRDIFIADKCNINSNSHASFPKSYNDATRPYQKTETTTNFFCGATGNTSFMVKEYEVYRVVW